jgi:hypothetical protein
MPAKSRHPPTPQMQFYSPAKMPDIVDAIWAVFAVIAIMVHDTQRPQTRI